MPRPPWFAASAPKQVYSGRNVRPMEDTVNINDYVYVAAMMIPSLVLIVAAAVTLLAL